MAAADPTLHAPPKLELQRLGRRPPNRLNARPARGVSSPTVARKPQNATAGLCMIPSVFNGLAAAAGLTIAPIGAAGTRARPPRDGFGPQNAKAVVFDGRKPSNLRTRTMHPTRLLQLCALPMALGLLLAPARAQAPEHSKDEAPLELPADEPLDLSTPEPDAGTLKVTTPFADKPSAPEWISKAGIDYSKPAIPAATFQAHTV